MQWEMHVGTIDADLTEQRTDSEAAGIPADLTIGARERV